MGNGIALPVSSKTKKPPLGHDWALFCLIFYYFFRTVFACPPWATLAGKIPPASASVTALIFFSVVPNTVLSKVFESKRIRVMEFPYQHLKNPPQEASCQALPEYVMTLASA